MGCLEFFVCRLDGKPTAWHIVFTKGENNQCPNGDTMSEIATARKAIKSAIKTGKIARESSGMHRVGMDAIRGFCKNDEIANELAWCAVKDVLLA